MTTKNPLGINGIAFMEYASPESDKLRDLFGRMGFSKVGRHKTHNIDLYQQGRVHFMVNDTGSSFALDFAKAHGPSICSMGWKVDNPTKAFESAVANGARPFQGEALGPLNEKVPAIYGIGDSLIYFVAEKADPFENDYLAVEGQRIPDKGLFHIDHLTNNVPKGEMQKWCDFYQKLFGFQEVRYFDIKGKQTGLISKVMALPDKEIIIPINEPTDDKSQIQEYIEEYNGSGIQHVALLTRDICETLESMASSKIDFLEVPDTYYPMIKERLPKVTEDIERLRKLSVLVDGDDEGYLLQIFTKNQIGPIFYEIIQRKNHWGFGEGNFQALFDAIERDQKERGYL